MAAGWAVDVLELSASGRARHEQLTTTTVQVPGQEEPRIVKRDIPASFSALVEKAGQDKNHLQKTVNVHESALTWIDNYEKCNSKSEQRRLVDLLLPGTSAVYAAIPSGKRMEVNHKALAFRIRMQFGLRAQVGGWHNTSAEELVREITAFYRLRRHDEVVDAIILAALESNLVACREVAKHFKCPYLTGHSVTPDGAVVLEDGTVVALDVTVVGDGENAAEAIRRKEHGWGTLGALEEARRERAEVWARCREEVGAGRMTPGQAQDARHGAALKVQGAWSGGCKRPVEMGGGIFVVVALTPYGGWFEEAKEWMSRVAHTGDKVPHCAWDERFEHPARTWASASHRAFTLQATGVAMANATYEFMRANATEEMRRVLGAKAANVQLAVPPTLAAGDWSVDSEGDGEGSSVDLHDGVSESDDNN